MDGRACVRKGERRYSESSIESERLARAAEAAHAPRHSRHGGCVPTRVAAVESAASGRSEGDAARAPKAKNTFGQECASKRSLLQSSPRVQRLPCAWRMELGPCPQSLKQHSRRPRLDSVPLSQCASRFISHQACRGPAPSPAGPGQPRTRCGGSFSPGLTDCVCAYVCGRPRRAATVNGGGWARGQEEEKGGRMILSLRCRNETAHTTTARPTVRVPTPLRRRVPVSPSTPSPARRDPEALHCASGFSLSPSRTSTPLPLNNARARAPGQDGGRSPLEGLLRPHQVHRRGQEQAGERAARSARERRDVSQSSHSNLPHSLVLRTIGSPRSALAARTLSDRTDHVGISAEVAALGRRARSPPTAPHPTISSPKHVRSLALAGGGPHHHARGPRHEEEARGPHAHGQEAQGVPHPRRLRGDARPRRLLRLHEGG
jgi:hypothetical protein